jgi:uncharacterized membrane protein
MTTSADHKHPVTLRAVNAGNGWRWISDGFTLFARDAVTWIALTVILVLASLLVNAIPVIGTLAFIACWPALTAGLMIGCRAAAAGERLEFAHLFAAFNRGEQTTQLLIVGALYVVAVVVIVIVMVVAVLVTSFGLSTPTPGRGWANLFAIAAALLAGLAVAAVLVMPVMMATWFAPPLIVFENMRATDAMKASFKACLKNPLPFLVYSVALLVLWILATLPLMLGLLVLLPVLVCSFYTNHQDIFARPAQP